MRRLGSKITLTIGLVLTLGMAAAACGDDDDGNTGTATLRVVHASPDAPAVDIYAAGVATPLVSNLAYGQASAYLQVDAGDYDIEIRAAGADATSAPVFSTGLLALPDGIKVTAVAAGLLGGANADDQFRVLPIVEGFDAAGSGNAIVRIVHASADAPTVAVDVGNDGTPEVSDLTRFADTGATGVPLPSATELQVGIWAGSPLGRVTAFTTPALPEGGEIFVIATGLVGELPRANNAFNLLAVGPEGAIGFIKQNPTVYAVHASPDAPAVDIYAGGAALAEGVSFGQISGAIQVPPASYTLDFFAAGTGGVGSPAAAAITPELAAGERYLAIANGFLARTDGSEPFQLIALGDGFDMEDTNARVRLVHGSPDAPMVDLSTVTSGVMDTPLLAGEVAFKGETGGPGISLPAGTYNIGVSASGSTSPIVDFDVTVANGTRAFAIAAGALTPGSAEQGFRLLVVDVTTSPWAIAEISAN